jgi:hypothetical protein
VKRLWRVWIVAIKPLHESICRMIAQSGRSDAMHRALKPLTLAIVTNRNSSRTRLPGTHIVPLHRENSTCLMSW